ncbi:MAG: hypothetical protein COB46_01900 [Rhodospirillaceae bacterium]|nr:MAG: hypothetical protein COB46_01900 [Rhodospirillaceae bacterium]
MSILIFDKQLLEEKQYWLDRLASGLEPSGPRLDELRPNVYGGKRGKVSIDVSDDIFQKLSQMTKNGSFLTATVLMASLMICLQKYNNSPAVVVGTPSRKPETGRVDNVLAIIEQIDEQDSFRDLLMKLRKTLLAAYDHQRYPNDRLMNDLGLEDAVNRHPLFDVAFVFDGIHDPLADLCNDITFSFSSTENGLAGVMEFNTDLYHQSSMELLAAYFLNILDEGLEESQTRIGDLSLCPKNSLSETLRQFNDTDRAFPDQVSVLHLIEDRAKQFPHDPALVFGDQTFSYDQMLNRIGAIAHNLKGLDVGPEVLVGVCLNDPLENILAVLGILKAGGAFLLLDMDYPDERLSFTLENSGAPLLISDPELRTRISCDTVKIVDAADVLAVLDAPRREKDDAPANGDHMAYVIYTSGSTGKPKGTILQHRGLCNLACAQGHTFSIERHSRVLQFSSFSFDASVSEIFMTLCQGGALHLARKEDILPGDALFAVLRDQKITHITVPPSLLSVLPYEPLPDLDCLIVAGEMCSTNVAEKWSKGRNFFNAYGPTESTVCATISKYSGQGRPLIGQPIDNTKIHILDSNLEPVAIGVVGELHIESVGLAREYIQLDRLTAEKFIQHPFDQRADQRVYKSGDFARWRANGEIEFLGRIDHQVKIRGFRIEPDEIAANLLEHPQIKSAVVIVREDDGADPCVVAYIVLADENTELNAFREFLRSKLPEYMHPSHIIALPTFPKLANGKIDRKALPAPGAGGADEKNMAGLARDNIELTLVQIWEELLNLRPVSVTEDFFAMGGHSLLAVKLVSRIQQAFEQKLPLDVLFSHSTIESLARVIRENGTNGTEWSPLVVLQAQNDSDKIPLFCVHPAGGKVLSYIHLARALGDQYPLYGLQARGFESDQVPFADIEEMAAAYCAALKQQQPQGPYQILGWSGGGIVAFEICRQLEAAGDQVSRLVLLDAYAPSTLPEHLKNYDDAQLMMALLSDDMSTTSLAALRKLTDEQRLAYLTKVLLAAGIIPPDYGASEVARFFAVYKVNCRLAHSPIVAPIKGETVVIRAADEGVLRELYAPNSESLGWEKHVENDLQVHTVAGGHNSMVEFPYVNALVDVLRGLLR